MSRTCRCLPSGSIANVETVQFQVFFVSCIGLPKCLATILILLGVLAQMTGEAVSSAAAAASGSSQQHYQVQRVMSMHNNFSSTLPFIPSSTSILTAAQHSPHHQQKRPPPSVAPSNQQIPAASSNFWQQQQQPSSSASRSPAPSRTVATQPGNNPRLQTGKGSLVSVPIRHWWMAVYHHHGDQHSSATFSSRVKRLLETSEAAANFRQCLQEDLLNPTEDTLTVKGEQEWEDRVCATSTLDDRVRVLLEALPCPQHKVCQILSPEVLQRLARPDQCKQVARDLWKNVFHKLYLMIRDFSDVLQQKFDIGKYTSMHQNQQCKEAYNFWICSTQLPMWLLNPDNNKSVEVRACKSTCLMVEKRCPFLIKGTEDDMASGNPSFMCKDANVPMGAGSTTPCCYTQMNEPLPGQGFPINVSSGFCHEPDHVQLHLGKQKGNSSSPGRGWSAASSASNELRSESISESMTNKSSYGDFHSAHSSCDKLLWPSASLNVTRSEEVEEQLQQATLRSTQLDLNATSAEAQQDSGRNLIEAVASWLGLQDSTEAPTAPPPPTLPTTTEASSVPAATTSGGGGLGAKGGISLTKSWAIIIIVLQLVLHYISSRGYRR